MNKKLTVTIGISAYNEEKNISSMLSSVALQKQGSFRIGRIIVVSDGSTDNTAGVARSFPDPRIRVIAGNHRLGKPARLNTIFSRATTDLVIIIDADVVLDGTYTLEALVQRFIRHPEYGLVGGNPVPLPAETFIEKAINTNVIVREKLRSSYPYESSAYIVHGSIMGFARAFYKTLRIPRVALTDDAYIYFTAASTGVRVGYAARARVLYRSPQTIEDHLSQATRYHAAGLQMYEFFGRELVDGGYYVPVTVSLVGMLLQFLFNPAGYVVLKVFHMTSMVRSVAVHNKMTALWKYVASSKVLNKKMGATERL